MEVKKTSKAIYEGGQTHSQYSKVYERVSRKEINCLKAKISSMSLERPKNAFMQEKVPSLCPSNKHFKGYLQDEKAKKGIQSSVISEENQRKN